MATSVDSSTSVQYGMPKRTILHQADYGTAVELVLKMDAPMVVKCLRTARKLEAVETAASFQLRVASHDFFTKELVPAIPFPAEIYLGEYELDDSSMICDTSHGEFDGDITAVNCRFRDLVDPAAGPQDVTHMDVEITRFFQHLWIIIPVMGRISMLTYIDLVYPHAAGGVQPRADLIRKLLADFYNEEQRIRGGTIMINGVSYEELEDCMDSRSAYYGRPLDFLQSNNQPTTVLRAGRNFFAPSGMDVSLDYRECWKLDPADNNRSTRVLVVIAEAASHYNIRQQYDKLL